MIREYSTLYVLLQHPWQGGLLVLVGVIVLLLPYEIISDVRSNIRWRVRAVLWSLEHTPGYTRLHMPGLRHVQQGLLRLLRWTGFQVRDRYLAGIQNLLRRWLG